ncbi:MAG TPA: hypothetical protein VJV78_42140 [Polyangiales bacterium]|nr:hypothetical protein [Polyangiales bacterium]
MHKKLGTLATMFALLVGSLISSGSAHAACTFGDISASAHDNTIISSAVFGNSWVFYGQNRGAWSNGGFTKAWVQRFDTRSVGSGKVYGVAYTTELMSNGTYTTVTHPYGPLESGPIIEVFPQSGAKISALQVLVYFCD